MSAKLADGILPALCTPFTENGEGLAAEHVCPLISILLDAGVSGFFVCGGTGEGGAMSEGERRLMVEATVSVVAGAVPIILQVGASTTEMAVHLAQHAAKLGVNAIASVAPIDRPNDLTAAVEHYAAIGAATHLPFYVYWLAHTADRAVTAEQYLEAMGAVPNFAGIKFTDTNFYLFQRLVALAGDRLNLISGPDEMCLSGMVSGADAAIGSTYNVMPKLFIKMRLAFEGGDIRSAMEYQSQANRVISVFMRLGVMGSIKALLTERGLPVGPPRPPHHKLDETTVGELCAALGNLEFEVS